MDQIGPMHRRDGIVAERLAQYLYA